MGVTKEIVTVRFVRLVVVGAPWRSEATWALAGDALEGRIVEKTRWLDHWYSLLFPRAGRQGGRAQEGPEGSRCWHHVLCASSKLRAGYGAMYGHC
jgi:hypothetical protein